jgi:CBS domain-containing protein
MAAMKVSELMTRDPVVVAPELPLAEAIGLMAERALRHLPVVERHRLVGVVSERDLLEATGWKPDRYADPAPKVVRDFMAVAVETVSRDDELDTAVNLFLDRRLGCLPVVDSAGRLEGILTVSDLLAAFVRACAAPHAIGKLDAVVASRMSAALITLDAALKVSDAIEACRAHGVRHLPVMSDGWLVGLVSDRDLRLRVGRGELERKLDEVMSTEMVTVGPEGLLSDAAELMRQRRVDSVLVTREGRLVGILTTVDVLERLREKLA